MENSKNKGFTLSELVVALSVGLIIIVMLSISFVGVQKVIGNKAYVSSCVTETEQLKQILQDMQISENKFEILENGQKVRFTQPQEKELFFENCYLVSNNDKLYYFSTINELEFEICNSFLICKLIYTGGEEFKFIV